jgi:competence protein ComEC
LFAVLAALGPCGSALAGEVRVDMIDVGQGDAILIRTPANKTVLIDAGESDSMVVAKLGQLGVDHLDLVVASHPHADHIGSMDEVVRAFPPKVYVDNGLPHTTRTYQGLMEVIEANPAIAYKEGRRGQVYKLDDGAQIEVLLPGDTRFSSTRSDLNANSVVTRLTHGDDCFLFLGDAEEPTERALVDQGVGECDVLKVAHHGSNYASSAALLAAVKPRWALISVGQGNRYGHPGNESLERLAAAGATVFRTDRDGTITAISDGKQVRVSAQHAEGGRDMMVPVAEMPTSEAKSAPAVAGADQGGSVRAQPVGQDTTDAESCPFPASRSSEVFHEAGCGNAHKISATNLVCYATRDDAVKAGKRPAGCCDP